MLCSTCSKSIHIVTRKKCDKCENYFCLNCLYSIKPFLLQICSTNNRCRICFLSAGNFNLNDLQGFATKELLLYLARCLIKVERGYERNDILNLVMRTSNQSTPIQRNFDHEKHVQDLMNHMNELQISSEVVNISRETSESNLIMDSSSMARHNSNRSNNDLLTFNNLSCNPDEIDHTAITPQDHLDNLSTIKEIDPLSQHNETNVNLDFDNSHNLVVNLETENESVLAETSENITVDNTEEILKSTQDADSVLVLPKRKHLEEIKDVQDLQTLSVRQLKDLLAYNYVDYKGCCERVELLQKVEMLWKDSQKNTIIAETSEELCRVCMDNLIDCVLLECGHMVTCGACGKRLAECPICRCYVSRVVRIFRA